MVVRKLKKIIKNGVEYILSFVDLETNQSVDWVKTFLKEPVLPSKTSDATNNGTKPATEWQVYKKQDKLVSGTNIKTINNSSILGDWDLTVSWLPSGWQNWQIVMMVNWTPTWVTPTDKWFVMDAWWPITIKYIWWGSDSDYANIGSGNYDSNTHYDTVPDGNNS